VFAFSWFGGETMDCDGQRLAELLYYWIIILFGAAGWVWGYFSANFQNTIVCWAAGVAISLVVRPGRNYHTLCGNLPLHARAVVRSGLAHLQSTSGAMERISSRKGENDEEQQEKDALVPRGALTDPPSSNATRHAHTHP
jgi:hypothetical protein